uniref:Uncharacterized protein n=1 Tax=Skeletonema marinoi TaxID=267567 RepID=A0A7S2LM67_9STRA|mmetsp:Transcript_27090/g.45903  ORF Transcript_27090/g.45903 Transcript_27090/m.45903 type:complete len:142 (+) Transcript_27090:33-458(+)
MKLTATLLVSIVAAAASDDSKMIRGGGLVATAADDETHKATHNVLRSVNFYEAAAQGDFEDIPNNGNETVVPSNPCPACATEMFCGKLGIDSLVSPCDNINNKCNQTGFVCKVCSSIEGNSDYVGNSVFRCEEPPSFDENA